VPTIEAGIKASQTCEQSSTAKKAWDMHDPGHAQVDFGEALAEIAGVERKIHFFAMDLLRSDACFVRAYPAETAEVFCDGLNAAFAFFGKVPRSILYDNTKLAVARILGDGMRQRTRVFS
jgi:transposase